MRVDGARFVVAGHPFAFVGANLAVLQGSRERARYQDTLRAAVRDGLTVGRVWAVGEGPGDASEWFRGDHLFRAGPDGFIEESYRQLDRVLAAAREQGLRLIITLANQWSDYGGVPMYLRWAGLPAGDGDAFYSDERTRAFFRAHVEKLLGRTNHVTSTRYVDDPTIFSWELMNESGVRSPGGAEARRAWIVEMARFIKARDPHHLVGAGLGGYGTRAERAEWIRVHRLVEIDYCDSHLYPQTTDRVTSWQRLAQLLDDRAQLARFVVGKPLVIGEFGFHTSPPPPAPARSRRWLGVARASWFSRFLDRLFLDGGGGALAWIYQPWLDRPRDFGIYTDRDATDDVRLALRTAATRVLAGPPAASNPRLGPRRGELPLYDPMVTLRGRAAVHDGWRRRAGGEELLEIPVEDFALARFEQAGAWTAGRLAHVYGVGAGRFTYRFAGGGVVLSSLRIEARLSSEWPGESGPPGGGSPVRLLLDGVEIARLEVADDDGAGRVEAVTLTDAPLLARLARAGSQHALTFEVPDVPAAHGLCVYGAPSRGGVRLPVGELGPIRLRGQRAGVR